MMGNRWHNFDRSETDRWKIPLRHRQRGMFFLLRFAGAFVMMTVLAIAGLGVLGFLLSRLLDIGRPITQYVWLGSCALAVLIPAALIISGRRFFRNWGTPLVTVMAAFEAVANGDLSVRVPEKYPGEFGRLARSFNRMAAELARSDQQRRHLTADVAHELRTPLHIIQGNLEGIIDGIYSPTPEHIGTTLEETRLLARLVDDLQTLSLAEAGQLTLTWEDVDVSELLADVQTSFSGQAEAAGIALGVDLASDRQQLVIQADRDRLDQVLGNLVANALRHTQNGGKIILHAEHIAGGVHLVIQDTGDGIPAEDLPFIFDRFWRGDRSRSHQAGAGSGLGLAISKQLILAHKGKIGVESAIGMGTTFTIDLPEKREPVTG
jgi:two-component system, OmpR family, sensor histidine kinase BaeS